MVMKFVRERFTKLFQVIEGKIAGLYNRRRDGIEVLTAILSQVRQNVA